MSFDGNERRNGIDDVSIMLGELRSDMRASQHQRESLFEKVEALTNVVVGLNAAIPPLVERINDNTDDISAQGKAIGNLKAAKNKLIGIVAGVASMGGVVGAMGAMLLTKFGLK